MKHIVYGMKAVFVGDAEADALVEYAAHVSQVKTSDTVDLRGFGADGNPVVVTFLLNSGTDLAVESTGVDVADLDNRDAIAYMREQTKRFEFSPEWLNGYHASDEPSADPS